MHRQVIISGFILLFSLFIPWETVSAQVVINELSTNTTSDWVEVYNTATASADLSVYRLEDITGNSKPLSGSIDGQSFMVVDYNNWLDNAGDTLRLLKTGESMPVDEISYGNVDGSQICASDNGQSIGSSQDGGGTIVRFSSSTQGVSNNGAALAPCPTPTPTGGPTNTPQPSSTPTPKPTSTPPPATVTHKKPSPTRTPTPSEDPTPTIEEVISPSPMEVLGETKEVIATPGASFLGGNIRPIIISTSLTGGGLALLSGVMVWKKTMELKKKRESETNQG